MSESARRSVLVVLGTRPEVIKLAPVVRALQARPGVSCMVCSTSQHDQLLRQALAAMELEVDVELEPAAPGRQLAGLTAHLVSSLDALLADREPDWVVVQGDTTSAFAGALGAFYRRVPVAHVEAGLRSGDRWAPFPEEVNRRAIALVADLHFAPTPRSAANLRAEGVPDAAIEVTGNTGIDALEWARPRVRARTPAAVPAGLPAALEGRRLVLVTGHRRESFGPGLRSICQALAELAERFEDVVVVYPLHLNPEVEVPVRALLGGRPRLVLLGPLGYLAMVWLLERAHLVLTDSGGIQEEAPSFGVPLVILRETTERPEVVEAGGAVVVGTDRRRIAGVAAELLSSEAAHQALRLEANPFGDGNAAGRIAATLCGGESGAWRVGPVR
ncbi:MAG TPA: UDP-N-acetylglucosamine 2-epimerase (non-hydrolyzing) [Acidimicrobiales bacterium]|nr:UDP-N-acetylglucosamine 2-epimerase (non-hydrolyzing) [Acidimicrobiales bacterium]